MSYDEKGRVQAFVTSKNAKLDELFARLSSEADEGEAELISNKIQKLWNKSGSDNIDLMMSWAHKALNNKNYAVALDYLDQITLSAPDYAEGWNRRATVHFVLGDYQQALRDIHQVLRLEPRHFGALSGLGAILRSSDKPEKALDAYNQILTVYPMMRSAQMAVIELTEEVKGQPI